MPDSRKATRLGHRSAAMSANNSLSLEEVRQLPATVDIVTAGTVLGIGRTKAYELARRDQFPCRVLKLGRSFRVPTAELLRVLGAYDSGEAEVLDQAPANPLGAPDNPPNDLGSSR